ncbi:uncharacterized protein LOC124139983 [Haliotis rufescens]|uniref:uncharacterized protein LOC124139983 n=1 Tax=Haliotis rufescens TaxID=6454 RepID=UPI00201FA364|nr:uncharacterized protein LOC124139983 [Haliotis rufescens]
MNYWSNIACVFYMLQVVHAGTPHTSKACYGTAGRPCTVHKINCNNTQKIDIKDAYYTDNKDCTVHGLTSCKKVNPDNVTESGKHSFNTVEMSFLRRHCSTSCTFRALRRNAYVAFSVVRYECSEESTTSGTSTPTMIGSRQTPAESTTSHTSTPTMKGSKQTPAESTTSGTSTPTMKGSRQTPAVVGGVVTTILVLIVITLTLVWYLRKRRRKTDQSEKTITPSKDVKTDFTYSLAGNRPQNHYHEIDGLKTNSRSNDYDYATADGIAIATNENNYFTIEPVTKPNTNQNSAPSATEDDYDHIGDKPSALTSNYDTTASVAQSAGTGAHPREDDYGYNLLQKETNPKTVHNDYDTTASAAKAVARLHGSNKTDENDYDHFPGSNSKSETLSSSHGGKVRDRSDDYAFAGPMS